MSGKKRLDLTIDPPPDLVVEIDIIHPSLNKLPIFSAVGVPEVWRYDGATVTIFVLNEGQLKRSKISYVLPAATEQMPTQFMAESKTLSALSGYAVYVNRYGHMHPKATIKKHLCFHRCFF